MARRIVESPRRKEQAITRWEGACCERSPPGRTHLRGIVGPRVVSIFTNRLLMQ